MKKILSMITAVSIACGCMLTAVHAEDGLILNTGFEDGEAGFSARGTATVTSTTAAAHSGTSSLIIEGRGGDAWNGAARGISGIKLDENYKAVAYIKAAEPGESFEVKMSLEMKDYNGTTYPQVGTATVNSDSWTAIEGTWKADYTGNLEILNLNFETSDNGVGKSFYVDDVFFAQSGVKQPQLEEEPVKQKTVTYSGIELAEDVAGTKYEKQIEIMQVLGVMDGYPDGTFKPENNVTRAEFLTMLLRLIRMQDVQTPTDSFTDVPASHFANGYIGYATSAGICDGYGDGLFGPDDTVTYAQAVKMLMCLMGYDTAAQSLGGYPSGYIAAANQQGIGVSDYTNDEPLNRGAVTALFETAIDAPLYMIDYGNNNKLYLDKNTTILSEYYDAVYEKGYVISSNTSTVSNNTSALGNVNIDGTDYKTGNTSADKLVGYYVTYIAAQPDKGDNGTLLYIDVNANRNDELIIKAEDIEGFEDYQYEYYISESKTKKVKLEKDFNLIYNGKTVTTGYSGELMTPVLGEVKLIANDSGNYSTVVVTSYDIYIVSAVNRGLKTIYSKNNDSIKLDYDAGDINISFEDKNGKELAFTSIAEDDVVQVASSLDGEEVKVIVTSTKAEGILKTTSEDEVNIDGTVYDVSDYFNENYSMPDLGKSVTVYLDMNGNVVYIGEGSVSGMTAGFINKCFIDEGADDYTLRIFSENGKFIDYGFTSNVNIDGAKYSSADAAKEIIKIIEAGSDEGNNFSTAEHRIILYSANSDKKISRIDTAAVTTDGEDTLKPGLTLSADELFSYKQSTGTFYNSTNSHYFSLDDEAIVFSVPNDLGNTSEYEIKSKSSFGWQDYEIYPFKAGASSLLTGYAVEFSESNSSVTNDGYVITKVLDGLNAAGDESKIVELYNGTKKSYALKDSDLWKPEWGKGTIVKIGVNSSGEISAIEEAKTSGKIISDYDYSGKGYIYEREGGWGYFTTSKPGAGSDVSDMVLIPISKFNIIVYNKRSEECYVGTTGDIVDYVSDPAHCTEIFITMNYENPKTMICIVDY